jgi:hypothetical protein
MMVRRVALALFLLLPSSAAWAQDSWRVALSGGAIAGFPSDLHPVVGLGVDRVTSGGLTVDGDFGVIAGETGSEGRRDFTPVLSITAGLRPWRGRTEPFFAIGGALVGSSPGLAIAAGVDQWLNARAGLRVEARAMSLGNESGTSSLRIGAVFRF